MATKGDSTNRVKRAEDEAVVGELLREVSAAEPTGEKAPDLPPDVDELLAGPLPDEADPLEQQPTPTPARLAPGGCQTFRLGSTRIDLSVTSSGDLHLRSEPPAEPPLEVLVYVDHLLDRSRSGLTDRRGKLRVSAPFAAATERLALVIKSGDTQLYLELADAIGEPSESDAEETLAG